MGSPCVVRKPPLELAKRKTVEDPIERMIAILDDLDADPDLESILGWPNTPGAGCGVLSPSAYSALDGAELVEGNLNAGVAYAFDLRSGVSAIVGGVGAIARPLLQDTVFFEGGARLGFRVSERMIVDTFVDAAAGAKPIGTSVHGGVGFRYAF